MMAAAGYVVFYDNHRGSTGYGRDFAMLLHNKYSSPEDFADHMSGVDAVIDRGIVDPDNLFITGGLGRRHRKRLRDRPDRPLQRGGGRQAGRELDQQNADGRLLHRADLRTSSPACPGRSSSTTGSVRRSRWSATW